MQCNFFAHTPVLVFWSQRYQLTGTTLIISQSKSITFNLTPEKNNNVVKSKKSFLVTKIFSPVNSTDYFHYHAIFILFFTHKKIDKDFCK